MTMSEAVAIVEREKRTRTLRAGTLTAGGLQRRCLVRDLSTKGCLVQIDFELELGAMVELSFNEHLAIQAQVRWKRDGRAGLCFGHRIVAEDAPNIMAHINGKQEPKSFVSWKE